MEQRARFVLDYLGRRFSMTELCYRYEVSRKTGYKWVQRYQDGGRGDCADRSKAPRTHPNATPPKIVKRILRLRRQEPTWGPKTLYDVLLEEFPGVAWPCPSTIGAILKRNDLIKKKRRRHGRTAWRPARTEPDTPNRVWTADFKGQFRLGNGELCYPLTLMDAYRRYLLMCRALKGTGTDPSRRAFEDAFREYGLPEVIRTDNGVPFGAPGSLLGLSTLSVWLLKLGIRLERSRPAKPQDNGSHERMHRTLKESATQPPQRNQRRQQQTFDTFQKKYNERRPHHALGMKRPATLYISSTRAYPTEVPEPIYPGHFEQRLVSKIGVFSWKGHQMFVSESLRGEVLGLEYVADGLWSVFFMDVLLGRFSEQNFRFTAGSGR